MVDAGKLSIKGQAQLVGAGGEGPRLRGRDRHERSAVGRHVGREDQVAPVLPSALHPHHRPQQVLLRRMDLNYHLDSNESL